MTTTRPEKSSRMARWQATDEPMTAPPTMTTSAVWSAMKPPKARSGKTMGLLKQTLVKRTERETGG